MNTLLSTVRTAALHGAIALGALGCMVLAQTVITSLDDVAVDGDTLSAEWVNEVNTLDERIEENAQDIADAASSNASFKWSSASFDSGWFRMQSQAGTNSFKQVSISPACSSYPSRVKVLTKSVDGANRGYIFEAMGMAQNDDDGEAYGGLIFAYTKSAVRLWAPDKNNASKQGYIIDIYDGWGGEKHAQRSHNADVRVLVWCN